jgi:hypothetical protein
MALSFSRFVDAISEVSRSKDDCSHHFRYRIIVASLASWNLKDDPAQAEVERRLNVPLTGRSLRFFDRVKSHLKRTAESASDQHADLWQFAEIARDIEDEREAEGRPLELHEYREADVTPERS